MKIKITHITAIAMLIGLALVSALATRQMSSKKNVDVVYVGSGQDTSSFRSDSANAKLHYDKLVEAGRLADNGQYDKAIDLLTSSLSYTSFKFQAAVVYSRLANIYKKTGDLKNEMESLAQSAKYTGNEIDRQESLTRVTEIQKILNAKK